MAGKAVVEAHAFETKQDWVGIMLAPSAIRRTPDLTERCLIDPAGSSVGTEDGQKLIEKRIAWSAFLQQCRSIPFHSNSPLDANDFDGFAIVPTSGVAEAAALAESLAISLKALDWLKSVAPDPAAQHKYQRAHQWLYQIQAKWREVAYWRQRLNEEKAG